MNRSLCELIGHSEAELLQLSFQEITHPDDLQADLAHVAQMLAGEIRTYQMEKRYRHSDGQLVWAKLSVSLVRNGDGAPLYFVSQIEDISARKQAERDLQQLADHDFLTGLLNRRRFYEELQHQLEPDNNAAGRAGLLLLDVDNFKLVNDTLGHLAGDEVLRAIADTLNQQLRADDIIARLGGDEFAALLLNIEDEEDAKALANELVATIRAQIVMTTAGPATLTASIGLVTLQPNNNQAADQLLAAADRALYHAKQHGRDRIEPAAA